MAVNAVAFGGEKASTATDNREMFLKVFGGEVLAAYHKGLEVTPRVRNRTIASGKSAQFPVIGRADAFFHTPGENLLTEQAAGSIANPTGAATDYSPTIPVDERIVYVDDKMVASVFIDDFDEAMSHYDYRSPFAAELGLALAYKREKLILRMAQKASAVTGMSAPLTNGGGDIAIGAAGSYTITQLVEDGIYPAVQKLDETYVPKNDRCIVVTPEVYWQLVQSKDIINRDYNGEGSLPGGTVLRIGGMEIVSSAILKELVDEDTAAAAVFPAVAGAKNAYDGSDLRNTLALVIQKEAVGSLTLMGLSMQMEYKTEYQGDLLVARIGVGHNYLRADAAVQITVTP